MEDEGLRRLLELELEPGSIRESLEALGLPPTYENAIYLQILRKAAGGDFAAAKYVLENIGVQEASEPPALEAEALRAMSTAQLLQLAGQPPEAPP